MTLRICDNDLALAPNLYAKRESRRIPYPLLHPRFELKSHVITDIPIPYPVCDLEMAYIPGRHHTGIGLMEVKSTSNGGTSAPGTN